MPSDLQTTEDLCNDVAVLRCAVSSLRCIMSDDPEIAWATATLNRRLHEKIAALREIKGRGDG